MEVLYEGYSSEDMTTYLMSHHLLGQTEAIEQLFQVCANFATIPVQD